MKIKKILFPFNKHSNLQNYFWHRLLLVVFFISLPVFLIWSWYSIVKFEFQPVQSCIDFTFAINSYDINHCFELAKVHHIRDIFIALGLTIIFSYLVQLIYHKIILYIFLGKKD